MGRREHLWSRLWGLKPNVTNRFDNYSDAYSSTALFDMLNKVFGGYEDRIRRDAGSDLARTTQNLTGSLASRGVTGSSILDDAIAKAQNRISKRKFDALTNLGIGKAKAQIDIANRTNDRELLKRRYAQMTDQQNFMNSLKKLMGISGYLSNWEKMDFARQNQPGTLSDIFSGIKLATQIASIPTGANANVLTSLFG